jgi:CRP/FNR family cyclic AMP-dependent transcriptional regulator
VPDFFRPVAGPALPTLDLTNTRMNNPVSSIFDSPDMAPEKVAARLRVTANGLDDFTLADAFKVVAYMRPQRIAAGTVFIQAGEVKRNDHMLLVPEGDIAVENALPGLQENMVVNVMGPGNPIGEMGLLDGSPRSVTCVATTQIHAAVLSRTTLMRLLKDERRVGARLLLAISKRMADRLRDTTRKLCTFAQMNKAPQQGLAFVMNCRMQPSQHQLAEAAPFATLCPCSRHSPMWQRRSPRRRWPAHRSLRRPTCDT